MIAGVVAYTTNDDGLWLLIVRTSDGQRWTFPKGHVEAGETPLEGAVREAYEEAGLVGEVEEPPLCGYLYPSKPDGESVSAFLMKVEGGPHPFVGQEPGRDPTWCTPEEARRLLIAGRSPRWAAEHDRLLNTALGRIDHLRRES